MPRGPTTFPRILVGPLDGMPHPPAQILVSVILLSARPLLRCDGLFVCFRSAHIPRLIIFHLPRKF